MTDNEVAQDNLVASTEEVQTQNEQESFRPVMKTGVFRRIFGWKKISDKMNACIDDLHEELSVEQEGRKSEQQKYTELKEDFNSTVTELSAVKSDLAVGNEKISQQEEKLSEQKATIENLQAKLAEFESKCTQLTETNSTLSKQVDEEDAKIRAEEKSWSTHVEDVATELNTIAQKNDFIMVLTEDYQYAGSPQNAFLFCKQYTIFDAISPKSHADLATFPTEIREYAETMKKYYKSEVVRSDIYLVVPTTTLAALDTVTYSFKEYTVHVIPPESMLSILLMLKNIETLDFASQIAEEGQDKICQILAKLSISAKRKVQLDTLYSKEVVSALKEIKTLPAKCTSEISSYEERSRYLALDALAANIDDVEHTYLDSTTSTKE